MAIARPRRAPLARHRAVGVLDGVQRLLNPGLQLVHRHKLVVRHAAVDDKERLRAHILAPLQILVVAEAVGRAVTPVVVQMAGAHGDVAEGVRPAEGVRQMVAAFDIAAARKPHKGRMQVVYVLRQIEPQTVGPLLEGLRGKQRDHIQPD